MAAKMKSVSTAGIRVGLPRPMPVPAMPPSARAKADSTTWNPSSFARGQGFSQTSTRCWTWENMEKATNDPRANSDVPTVRYVVRPVANDEGFQVVEAAFALADGGIAGTGIGLGSPTRIPEVETDFIFAAIGEELGLLGGTAVLCAYILMVGAGLRIALRASSAFDTLLATGLTSLLGIQAFIIIGGITRVLPLTGVTLPFVSYGGSSLVLNYVLLALLLRISDNSVKTGAAPVAEQAVR